MSRPTHSHALLRRAFTLTELLVVIAIIAVLAALASAGVMVAMSRAKATRIKVELDQIDAALKRYKDTYGSYPPCNLAINDASLSATDQAAVRGRLRQHLAMAFPRYDLNRIATDLDAAGVDLQNFRPDQALVFWLRGFSSDPTSPILSVDSRPISPTGTVNPADPIQQRTNTFFEFDPTRLIGVVSGGIADPAPSYFLAGQKTSVDTTTTNVFPLWQSGGPPLLYFDNSWYEANPPVIPGGNEAEPRTFNLTGTVLFPNAGMAAPYWHDRNGNMHSNTNEDQTTQESWANPDSYQLIDAGADGKYGEANPTTPVRARMYPSGGFYDLTSTRADDDNATNFTSKAKLGDDLP